VGVLCRFRGGEEDEDEDEDEEEEDEEEEDEEDEEEDEDEEDEEDEVDEEDEEDEEDEDGVAFVFRRVDRCRVGGINVVGEGGQEPDKEEGEEG